MTLRDQAKQEEAKQEESEQKEAEQKVIQYFINKTQDKIPDETLNETPDD